MKVLSTTQEHRIINNIVIACNDITKLNKTSYNWLKNCSGFYAHYDRNGFITYYHPNYRGYFESLRQAILRNKKENQYLNPNYGLRDYDYMMQKKNMYNEICERLIGVKR
jgi:hypothetical protein